MYTVNAGYQKSKAFAVRENMKSRPNVLWICSKSGMVSQRIEKMPKHQCYVKLCAGGAA